MTGDRDYAEERLAGLIGLLRPVPEGWIAAAQDLPAARRQLDTIVERCERDEAFRVALLADLERALATAGYELPETLRTELRARLA